MIKKGKKRYRGSFMRYNRNLFSNLMNLKERLESETWKPANPNSFLVFEPKERSIDSPPLEEKIIHRAIINVIEPLFDKSFIPDSYACRKNKGTHASSDRLMSFLRNMFQNNSDGFYVIKADISKYFHSINQDILLGLISKKIRDKKLMRLIETLIKNCPKFSAGIGLPLGYLTSQLFANVYLNYFDQFVKNDLKIKHYIRYMDDFVILVKTKESAAELITKIKLFLKDKLKLELNPKTSIYKYKSGIYFSGYITYPNFRKPRKINVKKYKRKFKNVKELTLKKFETLVSFLGYLRCCSGSRTMNYFLDKFKEDKNYGYFFKYFKRDVFL